jgi:hypothetical protein
MTIVRQVFAAILAASLVWTGSAGAAQAHMHDVDGEHGAAIHVMEPHVDGDHHVVAAHTHDHQHDIAAREQADEDTPDTGRSVLHVHSMCLVALEVECPSLTRALAVQAIASPVLVVQLHTRSITPADRPPRTYP